MSTGDEREEDHADVWVPLERDPRAPQKARGAVRDVFGQWRLPALLEDALVTVTELVTNAVRYGRAPLGLQLRRRGDSVRLGVHDADPADPSGKAARPDDDAESGRGLLIVSALARDVGVEQVPGDGKIVHATFDAPAGGSAWPTG